MYFHPFFLGPKKVAIYIHEKPSTNGGGQLLEVFVAPGVEVALCRPWDGSTLKSTFQVNVVLTLALALAALADETEDLTKSIQDFWDCLVS